MPINVLPTDLVDLVAINPARNMRRRWYSCASHDLLGAVLVETGWGRIGTPSRRLVRSFAGEAEVYRYVRALLARRGTALRRLGVSYVDVPICAVRDGDHSYLRSLVLAQARP